MLNLPPRGYSWALQRLAVMCCRSGAYGQAHEFVLAATGVSVGRRQAEQITMAAAADAERFGQDRDRAAVLQAGQEEDLLPLVISPDGKGVAVRPEARRPETARKAAGRPGQAFARRLGTGQKSGSKRIAETGVVFDVITPEEPRIAEQVMGRAPGQPVPEGSRAPGSLTTTMEHCRCSDHHDVPSSWLRTGWYQAGLGARTRPGAGRWSRTQKTRCSTSAVPRRSAPGS